MTIIFNSRHLESGPPHGRRSADYLRGFGAAFNISGSTAREYTFADSAEEADARALENDWKTIGGDLSSAIGAYRRNG